jgi:hypothetical protein
MHNYMSCGFVSWIRIQAPIKWGSETLLPLLFSHNLKKLIVKYPKVRTHLKAFTKNNICFALALAVAGGSSPHLLRATAALLMSPRYQKFES